MAEWRTIPGFPGYEASDDGRIRSFVPCRAWRKGRILTAFPNRQGYLRVGVCDQHGRKSKQLVSRLVCLAFHGEPAHPKLVVAHGNGVPTDNRPGNLRWATRRENYQDQILHGTSKQGSGHHLARLDEATVLHIRERAKVATNKELCAEFGLSSGAVSQIVHRTTWRHV